MYKILVDTCVWLDLAKDQGQLSLLNAIEELIKLEELSLIVPRTVIEEFDRNKERIIKESSQSLSSVIKRVKDFAIKYGDTKKNQAFLEQLNDLDFKIPSLGENAVESIARIERLIKKSAIIETSDAVKLKAVQRAIEKRAPFHRQKNSINDAIIMEIYASCIQNKDTSGIRFAFVTHNKNDFSLPNGNEKIPHPDFAMCFKKTKSQYFIKLAEAIHNISPELVTDIMIEDEWIEEPRNLTEILEVQNELLDKIWYNRHQNWLHQIKIGEHEIVDMVPNGKYKPNVTPKEIYNGALEAAKNVEKKYGIMNLGPWDDFEWGMMNGKLSALRWVIGEEWDNLDT